MLTSTFTGPDCTIHWLRSLTDHKDLRVSLAGLQALDLMEAEPPESLGRWMGHHTMRQEPRQHHRHIFAAGRCLDPELPDTTFTWSAAKSVFTLSAHHRDREGYHVDVRCFIFIK